MDYNVVNAPEMLRTLQQRLGIKQAHIAPTLAEHISPVVIVEDITATSKRERWYYIGLDTVASAATAPIQSMLYNPATSGVLVYMRSQCISFEGAGPFGDNIKWWYQAGPMAQPKQAGFRQLSFPVNGAGGEPPFNPVPGDLTKQPLRSQAFMQHQETNSAGAYIRSVNMAGLRGTMWDPMVFLLVPGTGLLTCCYEVAAAPTLHVNYEWEEVPIT